MWQSELNERIGSLDEMRDYALDSVRDNGPVKFAVAAGHDIVSIGAMHHARKAGLVNPVIIGDARMAEQKIERINDNACKWQIIDEPDPIEATRLAIAMVREGEADVLMRGGVLVRDFFQILMSKQAGLRENGEFWSVASIFDIDSMDRLFILTDCALIIKTDLQVKLNLIDNACRLARFIGIKEPLVALLAAAEAVSVGIPVSLEEAVLAKMAERGQFPEGVMVDGPLSLDLAINKEAVKKKNIKSAVAGKANILVVDNINIGNAMFKSLITLCGARSASTVVGASIPIAITSRSEETQNILDTIALNILIARGIAIE